jgi:hypothetical protein
LSPISTQTAVFRKIQDKFRERQLFIGDKAFVGAENVITPFKKPKNGDLTEEEEGINKFVSAERVCVEHVIRLVKSFRVAQERFRGWEQHYEQIMRVVCGLVRLRIQPLML